MGMNTSMPGQEGIPSVFSPMARTLDDLTYFTREFIKMGPWKYDHSVHPLEWRQEVETEYAEKKVLRVGVMRDDGEQSPLGLVYSDADMGTKASLLQLQHAPAL